MSPHHPGPPHPHGGKVLSFAERAKTNAQQPLLKCPACGSTWFKANVVIEGARVTGYTVPVLCCDCDTEVTP